MITAASAGALIAFIACACFVMRFRQKIKANLAQASFHILPREYARSPSSAHILPSIISLILSVELTIDYTQSLGEGELGIVYKSTWNTMSVLSGFGLSKTRSSVSSSMPTSRFCSIDYSLLGPTA